MLGEYDVIVVGGGHAGCEAASAAARMGSKTLFITMNMQNFAQMSCNPAMGGVAKGQLVREIDALGGYSGIVSDLSAIQFRMLNKSKGPAMWSPRTQNDRVLFSIEWRKYLESLSNLDFWQDMVVDVIVNSNKAVGVKTKMGLEIYSKSVILSNGTFLNGKIFIGKSQIEGGRISENASYGLTTKIHEMGIKGGRMKTGTPMRVDGRTIDFSKMDEQTGDANPGKFSFSNTTAPLKTQRSCFITYTNIESHEILKKGFHLSPLFNAEIKGVGPRYCPSIEDKIVRFSERERHQLFIEPEGWDSIEYYINGFSSSLPDYIQLESIRKVKGLEKVKMFRSGYAIEYDFFFPTQLKHSLETKFIENLYFAGQINGTTGYEEAAAQGLIAGINAHLKLNEKKEFVLKRSEAYIGVLIDDLVTKGTLEPYRMFTSRAEYRILLRQDNADIRLTEIGYKLGLLSETRYLSVLEKKESIKKITNFLEKFDNVLERTNILLKSCGTKEQSQRQPLSTILLRPEISIFNFCDHFEEVKSFLSNFKIETVEEVEIQIKYKSYIDKEREFVEKVTRLEKIQIPSSLDYNSIKALSSESKEKLNKVKPVTIGQASRISGVSPSDISVLLVFIGR